MSFDDLGNMMLGTAIKVAGKKHGIEITYSDDGFSVKGHGVFDRESILMSDLGEVTVTSNSPRFGIRLCDFPRKPSKGDKVALNDSSEEFEIVDLIDDGIGASTLVCHKVQKSCLLNEPL